MATPPTEVKVDPVKVKIMGINFYPLMRGAFNLMNRNETKRRQTLTKMNAPNPNDPVKDMYDCVQESPYEIEEVLKDKVWKVVYKAEDFMITKGNKKMTKMFLGDPEKREYQDKVLSAAKAYGDKAVETAKQDIEKLVKYNKKTTWTDSERIESVFEINMIVVKLNGGGLALYGPVKLHKDDAPHLIVDWLASLGPVEWLISASSAHTMLMGDAMAAFPEAKVVGPEYSMEKFKFAKLMKKERFDYLTDNKEDLAKLNEAVKDEGLEFVDVEGDVAVNAVVCCVHKEVVLECDIIYGHHDNVGSFGVDKDRFYEFRPVDWGARLFKFNLMDKPNSPLGVLPNYRFWLMDPEATGMMNWNRPTKDDKKKMAEALRKVNSLEFHTAVGSHIPAMSAEDFKKCIDANWNWLDGKRLY